MRMTKSFGLQYVKPGQKIIIYGAGLFGELALRGLEVLGLRADFFADRASYGGKYFGIPVIDSKKLVEYKNDIILIASMSHFYEMLEYLNEMGIDNYYDIEDLMLLGEENILSEYALDHMHLKHRYHNIIENVVSKAMVIPHCEIVVTERCTLKCKDCANLMQYYTKPSNLDIDETIQYFNNFLNTIDVLPDLRILGGEPFLCRDLHKLIRAFYDHPKVKGILIVSNATVVPVQEVIDSLCDARIAVRLSDYGEVSTKLRELEKIFEEKGIKYYVHHYEKWHDIGNLTKRNYNKTDMQLCYQTCAMSKCHTFYKGKFYLCPRSAHGETIGAFKNSKCEYVDFSQKNFDVAVKREELRKLISQTQYLTACDYCNGSNVRSKEIDAAIQIVG